MTKDVLITISGIQMMDEEDSDVEMIVRGDYYQKNGKHYILYDEVMEGFEGKVKNVIKISPVGMDIIKKGMYTPRPSLCWYPEYPGSYTQMSAN